VRALDILRPSYRLQYALDAGLLFFLDLGLTRLLRRASFCLLVYALFFLAFPLLRALVLHVQNGRVSHRNNLREQGRESLQRDLTTLGSNLHAKTAFAKARASQLAKTIHLQSR